MTPADNEIFYFVRNTSTSRFLKFETMALAFMDKTEEGQLRFSRVDWTQLTLAKNNFLNPDFILSLSLTGGTVCRGVEVVSSLENLNKGVIEFHHMPFVLVDKATHTERRKNIIQRALEADTEQQKVQEAAA